MFVNYKLEDIKSGEITLNNEGQKEDVLLIVQSFENEFIDITNWSLVEIAETITHRVYGLGNKNEQVYMKIDSNDIVSPWYFKNHDIDGYSAFMANSINEAIKQYEKTYKPKYEKQELLDELKKNQYQVSLCNQALQSFLDEYKAEYDKRAKVAGGNQFDKGVQKGLSDAVDMLFKHFEIYFDDQKSK